MRTKWAIRRDQKAVSPVIATILMVAITVVLAAVLYVMVSGLVQGPGSTPQPIGVSVTGDLAGGTQWKLAIASSPSTPLASEVMLVLIDLNGNATSETLDLLGNIAGANWNNVIDTGSVETVDAGDYIGLDKATFPAGTQYQLVVGESLAASGTL
ncbi:MAG: archaellin/type IV pilin N-terminal domain-containing protein [Thermoplasmata archaeon]